MQYETEKFSNQNIETIFADKIISFKGILKILIFFSIQSSILMWQFKNELGQTYITNDNFWYFNNRIIFSFLINYMIFFGILLLFFAFNLGKELKTRKKEKFILFTFKFFVIGSIFLLTNWLLLYTTVSYYIQAKLNTSFNFTGSNIYISGELFFLIYLWVVLIIGFILFKIFSLLFNFLSRNPQQQNKKISTFNPPPDFNQFVNTQLNSTNYSKDKQTTTPNSVESVTTSINPTLSPKEEQELNKKRILNNQRKEEQKKTFVGTKNKSELQPEMNDQAEKTQHRQIPNSVINFLDNYFFKLPLLEQIILFFTLSELFFLSLLSLNLYSISLSYNLQNYYFPGIIRQYAIISFLFYCIVAVFYYDILKNYFNYPKVQSRNMSLGLLGIGFILSLFSFTVGTIFQDAAGNYLYIALKYFVLFAIPIFYFGYINQNQDKSEVQVLNRFNPVYTYFYNKSINDLRMNERSYEITKKFLQLHKEDIKSSLINATPINFKDNIKTVILNDYERLETLLSYNGVKIKSRIAVLDFTMEVFQTFLVNIEVNLQNIYTEHLLKSSPENIHNPIANEFIESKFSKLFSQWESLEMTN